ncbi:glycosyltransferase family 2 protein [Phycicoccus duodecadis]|uniref:N-acetylglucosaminyl-diphospho-decaprenol L-rhamnosyltransferase n=1 Tax=Phycicoccus duodecadis TaxID=173053 RepID=A0A2N3YJV0_9MICO|nr:glycosyltransferase family 2 protein [Phycicoccus duodecadis]PKW27079.1 N-acetylglucosaminyl-diphospho-decaprenol L-rhamnosyltransferase [Phycicoccus duodecadis]
MAGDASPGGVSVVVPHHGDPAPTLATVRALLGQTYAPLQVVVSDDASPDPFPEVDGALVVRRAANGGFGSAVNTGAAAAEHPLLLVLNSDVTLGPTFVADLVAAATPWMPAVAGPLVLDPGGHPSWTARHFPTVTHQSVEWLTPLARFRHHRALHEAVGHDTRAVPGAVLPVDWVVGAALLLPTEALRAVGGFDQRYFMNSEEIDLQRRLRARGVPSVFVGTVSLVHVGGGSSDPARRRRWLVESRLRYAGTWGGRRRLKAALTLATGVNAVVNTGRRAVGRDVRPLETAREELSLIHGGPR